MELHEPHFFGDEIKNIKKAIDKNEIAIGSYTKLFEKKISNYLNSKYVLATNSGTSSLHIALKLSGVKENTEVLISTITFIAPVNAILYNNASPIFMDTDEYFNINVNKTVEFIKKETYYKNGYTYNKITKKKIVSIIIVHVFGNPANIFDLYKICKKRNIKIIEDCAESLGSSYKNKINSHTGTIGDFGCFSFNGNKIITTSSGGMIALKKKSDFIKARLFINQYKNDNLKFIHNNVGYNYRMTNINAAIGLAQFKNIKKILAYKKSIYINYKNIISSQKYSILDTPNYAISNNWLNLLKIKKYNPSLTSKLINKLIKYNINVRYIWFPNHLQKHLKQFQNYKMKNYKNYISYICLPSGFNINKGNINLIKKIINE